MLVRTEYSFGVAFGGVDAVLARLPRGGIIADTTCFGHVPFAKAAAKAGKRAALGYRVRIVEDLEEKDGGWREVALIPRTPAGLTALYASVKAAEGAFYRTPRLPSRALAALLSGGVEWFLVPLPARRGDPVGLPEGPWTVRPRYPTGYAPRTPPAPSPLVLSDNFYPAPGDREAWGFACPRARPGTGPGHILLPEELAAEGLPEPGWDWLDSLDTPLPRAENIRYGVADADAELRAQCEAEATRRGLLGAAYRERLEKELALIGEKKFADYFLVIGDMLRWAKERMLVGPARGSSCGSLVCWLTRITEVDPLVHDLIFERFVDLNRMDLPDIDIDFPDVSRHLVIEYLAQKYGQENVAHLGTVLRYKPRSALADMAKALRVPDSELNALKDVMIERSSGDARVNDCLADSLASLEAGKELLRKHPGMILATKLEGAAKTSGTHAAGIIVCNAPVSNYCAVGREGIAQIEKKSAEALNMLKIDTLGLRTLSVIESACAVAGIDRETLYTLLLDDGAAFAVLNDGRFSGIFQFEGMALQSLAQQIRFREFNDIAAVGALARPGPLSSGEAQKWIARQAGKESPTPPHPMMEELTRDTYGVVMYQEQVMKITRELAGFSWKETGDIRKLMSNRQGDESFFKWTDRFIDGCIGRGIEKAEAEKIWKAINTFGCVAGNTIIELPVSNQYSPKQITVRELFHNGGISKVAEDSSNRAAQRHRKAKIWNWNGERIHPRALIEVMQSGIQTVWALELEDGKMLRATGDHRIMTEDRGWTELKRLRIGERIAILGAPFPSKKLKGTDSGAHNHWHGQSKLFIERCAELRSQKKGRQIAFSPVRSRRRVGKEMTYDIAMPSPHNNFIANGIVVHNSWAFNRSHAVAYGVVSYWCCWLKAHYPLEFALGCLQHARDDESAVKQLRELTREGIPFVPLDPERSRESWSIQDGKLYGGLLGVRGIGPVSAREIENRNRNDIPLKPSHVKLLAAGSVYSDIFPTRRLWGEAYEGRMFPRQNVKEIADIITPGERVVIIGRIMKKSLRNMNEDKLISRRNGRRMEGQELFLILTVVDDTEQIVCIIDRHEYLALGAPIIERAPMGQWLAIMGKLNAAFRSLIVQDIRWLDAETRTVIKGEAK